MEPVPPGQGRFLPADEFTAATTIINRRVTGPLAPEIPLATAPSVIVATYAEIALKGRNRSLFMRKLISNIRTALQDEPLLDVQHVESRLLVHLDGDEAFPRAAAKLRDVFGLQLVSPVASVLRPGLDAEIAAAIAEAVQSSGAKAMSDMGKVMAALKPKLAGRADMGKVSALVKSKLAA